MLEWNEKKVVIQRLLILFEIGVAPTGVNGLMVSHMMITSLVQRLGVARYVTGQSK